MRQTFINWVSVSHKQLPHLIPTMGPTKWFDSLLEGPDCRATPKRSAMADWMIANREECLKIIASIGGFC